MSDIVVDEALKPIYQLRLEPLIFRKGIWMKPDDTTSTPSFLSDSGWYWKRMIVINFKKKKKKKTLSARFPWNYIVVMFIQNI